MKKEEAIIIFLLFFISGCSEEPASSENSEDDFRFITANPLNLSQIQRISLFRSCIGHDYSGLNQEGEKETLRSMKHYIEPLPSLVGTDRVQIFAPFDGEIAEMEDLPPGKLIYIDAKANFGWRFVFFHVIPTAGLEDGSEVQAGELIGTASPEIHNFDIALKHFGWKGQTFDSPFLHFTQPVLEEYATWGLTPENSILSKLTRDAQPCPVEGTLNRDARFIGYKDEDFVVLKILSIMPVMKEKVSSEILETDANQ